MPAGIRIEADRERRLGRLVGCGAFASVAAFCGALIATNAADGTAGPRGPGPAVAVEVDHGKELSSFYDGAEAQLAAVVLRCTGLLLTIAVALYLLWMLRRRATGTPPWVTWCAVLGPMLVAGATVVGYLELHDLARTFMTSGPRTQVRADDLVNGSATLHVAGVFEVLSRVVFGAWLGAVSLYAMRAQLLTAFLGYWGIGAGGALVLLPLGDAMFVGWIASMGFLAVGYWPGGRPDGWTASTTRTALPSQTSF